VSLHRINIFIALLLSLSCIAGPSVTEGAGLVRFALHAPDARQVFLAGTFNRWDPSSHALTGPDEKGTWSVSLTLAPGRYEYLFVVNGTEWTPDPGAPWADDGFGGRNSVVVVPGDAGR
jgi:1,4-alpha-glucan branching enzyme